MLKFQMSGSERKPAGVLVRVVAKCIDLLIVLALAELPSRMGYVAGIFYLLISDAIWDGRSVGKRLTGLSVVSREKGLPCSFRDSIIRNMTLAAGLATGMIPLIGWILGWICAPIVFAFEFVMLLGNKEGMRFGDELAGTAVIETPEAAEAS